MKNRVASRRRFVVVAYSSIIILLANPLFSASAKEKSPKISLRLAGEAGFISIGDINDGLRTFNMNPVFQEIRMSNPSWASLEGNIRPLKGLFGNWEAELRIDFLSKFGLGIAMSGAEVTSGNESFLKFTNSAFIDPVFVYEYSYKPEIMTSAPFRVTLYYYWRRGGTFSIYFNGGAGYYKGKMSEQYDFRTYDDPATFDNWTTRYWETEWKASFGWHLGAGMEIRMGHRLSIIAELQGRYAVLGNFHATQQYETGYPQYEETTGWLYYCTREDLFIGGRHADLTVWEVPPFASIDFIGDVRKARLDLSGLSLRVGLRLKLF
jgi:opacity protein-like surface antigen